MADLVAGCVEWFGLEDYDISADLLRHYMSGRGAEYQLDMPQDWAEKIASKYKKKGTRRDVSSYEWGIPDMKNSLGYFDLTIDDIAGGGKLYTVTDKYYFPYKPKDKWEQGDTASRSTSSVCCLRPSNRRRTPRSPHWVPGRAPAASARSSR
jgi:hypothetical protein